MGFFSLGKEDKPQQTDVQTVAVTQTLVNRFFELRQIENFKVYVVLFDRQPIVLVKAQPQKKLRFSNILEIQIRQFVKEHAGIDIPAVFWRFRTDYSDDQAPEQADYDAEPAYPDTADAAAPATADREAKQPEREEVQLVDDIRLLKKQSIAVEEISLDEFENFLNPNKKS